MAALIPHSQSESPGSLARVMADSSLGVLAAVARVFKFTKRAVRQDAPESFDQYFADFAKTTPIVSVVFKNVLVNGSGVHVANMNEWSINKHGQQVTKRVPEGHTHD